LFASPLDKFVTRLHDGSRSSCHPTKNLVTTIHKHNETNKITPTATSTSSEILVSSSCILHHHNQKTPSQGQSRLNFLVPKRAKKPQHCFFVYRVLHVSIHPQTTASNHTLQSQSPHNYQNTIHSCPLYQNTKQMQEIQ
jgi:hypothetical protein